MPISVAEADSAALVRGLVPAMDDKGKEDEIRRWRARAEECRAMAREMKSNEGRQRLIEEAESLDQMADRAEASPSDYLGQM